MMESIRELYKLGRGPSSSHTIGPEKACQIFRQKNAQATEFKVILYGSLAKTGKGHATDEVVKKTLSPIKCDVQFDYEDYSLPHPNTMDLVAYKDGVQIDKARVMSVGGGSIAFEGEDYVQPPRIYKHDKFSDISDYCKNNEIKLYDYVMENEDEHILDYVRSIWQAMKKSIKCGLADSGVLPGGLEVEKKARFL